MAAKHWKNQLRRAIPSFQLCRHASRRKLIAESIYRLSPVNPKSFDITYPSFSGNSFATAVPPSTPEDVAFTVPPPPRRSSSSRTSRLNPSHLFQEGSSSSSEFQSKNEKRPQEISTRRDRTAKSSNHKKASEETDTETLLSPETSRSFSEEWSSTSADIFTDRSRASTDHRRRQPPSKAVQNNPPDTVAVVKRSENPLEDFKSSMWEVVVEKRLVKPNELEQLLLSFLSLNSRRYHGVIVEAFSEIWRALFSDHGPLPDL